MLPRVMFEAGVVREPVATARPKAAGGWAVVPLGASKSRLVDEGRWETDREFFIEAKLWFDDFSDAEDCVAGLSVGDQVVVTGDLVTESWVDKASGEKRSRTVLHAFRLRRTIL